jgi:hypothetical protein
LPFYRPSIGSCISDDRALEKVPDKSRASGPLQRVGVRQASKFAAHADVEGIAAGIVGTLSLTRLIRSLLVGVGTNDPVTLAAVVVTLVAVAVAACAVPAWRALRIDPHIALRWE